MFLCDFLGRDNHVWALAYQSNPVRLSADTHLPPTHTSAPHVAGSLWSLWRWVNIAPRSLDARVVWVKYRHVVRVWKKLTPVQTAHWTGRSEGVLRPGGDMGGQSAGRWVHLRGIMALSYALWCGLYFISWTLSRAGRDMPLHSQRGRNNAPLIRGSTYTW